MTKTRGKWFADGWGLIAGSIQRLYLQRSRRTSLRRTTRLEMLEIACKADIANLRKRVEELEKVEYRKLRKESE